MEHFTKQQRDRLGLLTALLMIAFTLGFILNPLLRNYSDNTGILRIGVFSDSPWGESNGYSHVILNQAIAAFEKKNPGVKVVYESGIPIYMAGLDVTEKALVFPEDFERIRAVGNKVAEVVADWLEFFYGFHRKLGYPGAPVHDAVAVAALIKPEIMTFKDLYVQVETAGDYCKGTTVGDWYGVTGKAPNASCILDIDRQGFVDLLVEAVKTYA